MKNFTIVSIAGLAVAASANAAGPSVIDISGAGVQGTEMQIASTVDNGNVTDIAFDIGLEAFSPSWGSEVNINIDGPSGFAFSAGGGADPADLTFGWGNSSGTFTFSGTASLSDPGGAGTYTVSVFDSFDDFPGEDNAVFLEGSTITLVPTPGAAALLGMGGLAATRRRR